MGGRCSLVRPLDLSATALPGNVGGLRRAVRRWLADHVDDADVVDDLVGTHAQGTAVTLTQTIG